MLSEEDQLKLTDAIASGLLNWTDEARKLIQLLTPCWKAAYEDGATVAGDATASWKSNGLSSCLPPR